MPNFILLCRDKPGAIAIRQETRPAHLDYITEMGGRVLLAGPMLNEADAPIGSMLIIDAADAAEAKTITKADPYAKAGLFEDVQILPYRIVTGSLAAEKA